MTSEWMMKALDPFQNVRIALSLFPANPYKFLHMVETHQTLYSDQPQVLSNNMLWRN